MEMLQENSDSADSDAELDTNEVQVPRSSRHFVPRSITSAELAKARQLAASSIADCEDDDEPGPPAKSAKINKNGELRKQRNVVTAEEKVKILELQPSQCLDQHKDLPTVAQLCFHPSREA